MATFGVTLAALTRCIITVLALCFQLITPGSTNCLTGCSCSNDNFGRSLLCMETTLGSFPANISNSFTKIRIENSHLTELPHGSFSESSSLESLWLNFNNITLMSMRSLEGLGNLTELRLQGNKLSSVPWTAFQDTPKLKILDLKHNRLDALPEHALRHLSSLTYLDLSSNELSVVSKDVFVNWPLYRTAEKTWGKEGTASNVVLALHDNPWLCDCRLKGFVEFVRTVGPPIILMNSYLTCAGPAGGPRAGRFFHEVQLKTCAKPEASIARANVTSALGVNVTLTCSVTARPDPTVQWMYSLKVIRGFAVTETHLDDETVTSQLVIPSLHLADRGVYTCTASNFLGNSSASVLVAVEPFGSSPYSSGGPVPPPFPMVAADNAADENVYIDIRIAKQTVYGITLEWYAVTPNPAETWYTVHFGRYDSPKKDMVYVGPGISSYSVADLLPLTKYEVCVALKNRPPRGDQCVVFVTGSDVSELEQRERLIHIIVIVSAMVLAVPAGMYACTTEFKFDCAARCAALWRKGSRCRRSGEEDLQGGDRQGTFDSLQAGSSDSLCGAGTGESLEVQSLQTRRLEDAGKGGTAAALY